MTSSADRFMRQELHEGARGAYTGYERSDQVICVLCAAFVNRSDAHECKEGHLCVACSLHPRFDIDTCPDCGADWAATIRACSGCGLTIEAVAERAAATPTREESQ